MTAILLHPGRHGHEDVIIQTLSESAAFLFPDPDDAVGPAVYANFLANRVRARHQVVDNVGPNDRNGSVVFQIGLAQHAAGIDIDILRDRDRRRHPLHHGVGQRSLVIFHIAGIVTRIGSHICAQLAALAHGSVVIHGEVFALLAFDEMVDIGDRGGDFKHDEYVGAEIEDFFGHVSVDAVDECDHGDYGGHSDHDSEQSERGTELVCPQRQERDLDRLGDVHWLRAQVSGFGHRYFDLPSLGYQFNSLTLDVCDFDKSPPDSQGEHVMWGIDGVTGACPSFLVRGWRGGQARTSGAPGALLCPAGSEAHREFHGDK